MDALKALETRTYDSGATVRFQDVDYNVLTFKQQIKIDLGERLQQFHIIFGKYFVLIHAFAPSRRQQLDIDIFSEELVDLMTVMTY